MTLAVTVSGFAGLWVTSIRFLSHLEPLSHHLHWCHQLLGAHDSVGPVLGVLSTAAAAIGTWRFVGFIRLHRRLRSAAAATRPSSVTVIETPEVFAYALPGASAATVLSRGLLSSLRPEERQVVIAHEDAHHRHRHDRYLLIARAAEAAFPPIRVLTRRLEFELERWADDEATTTVGGDRRLVARTIARVCLLADPRTAGGRGLSMAFAGTGPAARVEAILSGRGPSTGMSTLAISATVAGVATALVQLHHLEMVLGMICGF